MAKKRGAPRKPPDEAKGVLMQIRVDAAEKQAFTEAAALCGQKLSVWVRDQLRQIAKQKLTEAGKLVAFLSRKTRESES
jgi:uncharacterized protein (DUF1778 family)